ncbi:MAG: UDP-N-acetylmuramoyl-L-alanine--D-glutamate ligase [Thermodesulfobacteriota bacterium]|nr:UDP-N-acetylmuramoyl-L-alanine--D-glutamate ligase [Thermodesulfobacteriota bacterium]
MNIKDEKYIVVAGMGKSGLSIARFLKACGHNVVVTDIDPLKKEIGRELEKEGIKTEIGFHKHETFENAEKIVTSPGIPLDIDCFQRARKNGVSVTGELDLFFEYIKIPVIAVTGTNGKTTVTTMITGMLKASGVKVFTGGNIGTPLVDYFLKKEKADVIVAEVSSFQLDTADFFKPDVALLLNITQDHLDRYHGFNEYQASKWSIFKNQTSKDTAIINSDLDMNETRINQIKSETLFFNLKTDKTLSQVPGDSVVDVKSSTRIKKGAVIEKDRIVIKESDQVIDISGIRLKGMHNKENIAAASLAVLALGGNVKGIESFLAKFTGLAHRIEYAGTINNIEYYNDSKATNSDAVIRALESFGNSISLILIMGGKEKNSDFTCLKQVVKKRVKKIIALGEAKEKIHDALGGICDFSYADSMEQVVDFASKSAVMGDTVLLSPACASFDMYKSYSHRGDDFVKYVKKVEKRLG